MGVTIYNKPAYDAPKGCANPSKPRQNFELRLKNHLTSNPISWRCMTKEWWRLHTFVKYPREAPCSPILLAKQGFAYVGNGEPDDDTVMCVFCLKAVKNLDCSEKVCCLNDMLSANCPMASGGDGQNIVIDECSGAMFSQISSHFQSPEPIRTENRSPGIGAELTLALEVDKRREILTSRPLTSLCDGVILQEQGFEDVSTVCLRDEDSESLQPSGSHEYVTSSVGVAVIRDRNLVQSSSLPCSEITNAGASRQD